MGFFGKDFEIKFTNFEGNFLNFLLSKTGINTNRNKGKDLKAKVKGRINDRCGEP
jgi:hypothetical protein